MVSRIIVPLDQSYIAECALPYARSLAKLTSAPLQLLVVIDAPAWLPSESESRESATFGQPFDEVGRPVSASMPFGLYPGSADVDESEFNELQEREAEANEYLSYVSNSISDVAVETYVLYGDPAQRILQLAATDADAARDEEPVIVMATHGRSGLGRVLLGSVALKIAEQSPCPMFLIRALRQKPDTAASVDFERVLVALDGSEFSEAVLPHVEQIFGTSGAKLHLLRSVESERSWLTGEHDARPSDGRTERDESEEYLSAMADQLGIRGYTVTWDVPEGDPADRINEIAESADVDLIALATHGRSGLTRIAVGSVAEEVLHKAPRPLMLVRPEAARASEPAE